MYPKFADHFINVTNGLEFMPELHGTSFHNVYAQIEPERLITVIGNGMDGDEYKVSQEWEFVTLNDKGEPHQLFTLYDWKETNLYSPDSPSPEIFWKRSHVELHIGHKGENLEMARKLKDALELVAGADIPPNVWTGERMSKLNIDELTSIRSDAGIEPYSQKWER